MYYKLMRAHIKDGELELCSCFINCIKTSHVPCAKFIDELKLTYYPEEWTTCKPGTLGISVFSYYGSMFRFFEEFVNKVDEMVVWPCVGRGYINRKYLPTKSKNDIKSYYDNGHDDKCLAPYGTKFFRQVKLIGNKGYFSPLGREYFKESLHDLASIKRFFYID